MQVKPNAAGAELLEIFEYDEGLLSIVDIGSNAIEGAPPYRPLVEAGLAHVIGFEPQSDTIVEVPGETHLPYAIGDGKAVTFRTCQHSGWSSTLKPEANTLAIFEQYAWAATVTGEERMKTRKLDDVAEIERIDMLKIDIQGGEMAVFKHGAKKLAQTLFIHTETPFVPLYEGQPVLGDIDLALRRLGFIPHTFGGIKKAIVPPFRINNDPWTTLNQLLDGDMIYVRDFRDLGKLEPSQVKAMGLIAHACYNSWDLAYFCLNHLVSRDAIQAGNCDRYLTVVNRLMTKAS